MPNIGYFLLWRLFGQLFGTSGHTVRDSQRQIQNTEKEEKKATSIFGQIFVLSVLGNLSLKDKSPRNKKPVQLLFKGTSEGGGDGSKFLDCDKKASDHNTVP